MRIQIQQPKGILPRSDGCPVGPEYAEVAENIDLTQRGWVPWKMPRCVHDGFTQRMLSAHVRDCCFSGVPVRDAHYLDAGVPRRTILSGRGERAVITDSLCDAHWCRLGYPIPDRPVVTVRDWGGADGPFTFPTRYKLAYADDCDEVGPGSEPSEPVKLNPKAHVEICLPRPPDVEWHASYIVVYRLVPLWDTSQGFIDLTEGSLEAALASGELEAEYFEVGRVPVECQSFTDRANPMGPALVTDDLYAPKPGLRVVGETTLGSTVGWLGRELWFSERNAYWGYPPRARHLFPYDICHVRVCRDRVIVVTAAQVFVVVDDADCRDSMSRSVIEGKQEIHCCGTESYVGLPNGVLYTTAAGLMLSDVEGSTRVVSDKAFEKDDWRALGPNCSHLGIGCGHLFLSTHQGTYVWPLSFDENGQLPEFLSTLSFTPDRWFNDEHGHLYFLSDNRVYQFNEGDEYMHMNWRQYDQRWSARTQVSAMRLDYKDKKLSEGNKVILRKAENEIKHSTRANRTIRMRNTLGDCFSVHIIGTEPMCGVFYGVGKTGITVPRTSE